MHLRAIGQAGMPPRAVMQSATLLCDTHLIPQDSITPCSDVAVTVGQGTVPHCDVVLVSGHISR
jgi:hypothetical protein